MAIWATNLPQWYVTFWATTKIGAVLVTVNTAYKAEELDYVPMPAKVVNDVEAYWKSEVAATGM